MCSGCGAFQKLGFWCRGDPCRLGQNYAGSDSDDAFLCKCETNSGAVAGMIVGCIAIVALPLIAWCCYRVVMQRRQQMAIQGAPQATAGAFSYNPAPVSYAQPLHNPGQAGQYTYAPQVMVAAPVYLPTGPGNGPYNPSPVNPAFAPYPSTTACYLPQATEMQPYQPYAAPSAPIQDIHESPIKRL